MTVCQKFSLKKRTFGHFFWLWEGDGFNGFQLIWKKRKFMTVGSQISVIQQPWGRPWAGTRAGFRAETFGKFRHHFACCRYKHLTGFPVVGKSWKMSRKNAKFTGKGHFLDLYAYYFDFWICILHSALNFCGLKSQMKTLQSFNVHPSHLPSLEWPP